MEKLLGFVSLGFLLRTAFAGGFYFVSSFHAMSLGVRGATEWEPPRPEFVLGISMFAGFACYAFHRGLVYPIFE